MHYLYILEGRLKYETISFESEVVFNLYNKNVERRAESVGDDDLVYFLKSDVDTIISVNLTTNKILLSAPFSQTILLFDQAGSVREVIAEREIDLSGDIVKFKIVDIDFSFLINTMTDPDKGRISVSNLQTSTSTGAVEKIKIGFLNFIVLNKFSIFIFIILLVFIFVSMSSLRDGGETDVPSASSVVFNNESELMRANLQGFNSKKILVKTHLMKQIQLYFEQQGYRYVKFDLEKQGNGNFNLVLFIFPNSVGKSKNFNLVKNQFQWIESVIVNTIDMKDMITDFNNLATKYDLKMINKKGNKAAFYQLVEVSFVNSNLRFESLQRDLNTFYERWGNNYIEFNVSLKKHRELPIDFILKRSDEEVIKSDQGFYIN